MFLCKVTTENLNKIYNSNSANTKKPDPTDPPVEDFGLVMIGQAPDCSSYLALATKSNPALVKQSSIPEGYDFIFRQSWGLIINEDIINRVVDTLRAEAYPPITDYLDAKVKGDTAQEQAYLEACLAVKAKYPKFSW